MFLTLSGHPLDNPPRLAVAGQPAPVLQRVRADAKPLPAPGFPTRHQKQVALPGQVLGHERQQVIARPVDVGYVPTPLRGEVAGPDLSPAPVGGLDLDQYWGGSVYDQVVGGGPIADEPGGVAVGEELVEDPALDS